MPGHWSSKSRASEPHRAIGISDRDKLTMKRCRFAKKPLRDWIGRGLDDDVCFARRKRNLIIPDRSPGATFSNLLVRP
jgi:hypothetical protein